MQLLAPLFISFCWGFLAVINKYVLKSLQSSTVMILTACFYFLLLIGFSAYNQRIIKADLKKITYLQYFYIFISAFFGIFICNVLYYYYLKRTKASIFSAIIYSAPLFTLIGSYFLLNEKILPINLIGIGLIVSGIFLVSK